MKENLPDHVFDKGFASRLYKDLSKLNKKTNNSIFNKLAKKHKYYPKEDKPMANEHMKTCWVISHKKMQVKSTMRYYYIPIRKVKIKISDHTSVNKNFEKLGILTQCCWVYKMAQPQFGNFFKG